MAVSESKKIILIKLALLFVTILNLWTLFPGDMMPTPLWLIESNLFSLSFNQTFMGDILGLSILLLGQTLAIFALFMRSFGKIAWYGFLSNIIVMSGTAIFYLFNGGAKELITLTSSIPFLFACLIFWIVLILDYKAKLSGSEE